MEYWSNENSRTPVLHHSNTPNFPCEVWKKLHTLTILLTSRVGKKLVSKNQTAPIFSLHFTVLKCIFMPLPSGFCNLEQEFGYPKIVFHHLLIAV